MLASYLGTVQWLTTTPTCTSTSPGLTAAIVPNAPCSYSFTVSKAGTVTTTLTRTSAASATANKVCAEIDPYNAITKVRASAVVALTCATGTAANTKLSLSNTLQPGTYLVSFSFGASLPKGTPKVTFTASVSHF